MYREAYLELQELARTNPALAEKVANEILGGIEKVAAEQVPSFAEVMTKVAGIFPDEVDFLQKIAFNFADAMHAQGLSPEELEKKLQQTAFKNDPAGAIGKRVGQATEAVSGAATNAAGTISDTVLGAGDTIRDVANGAKETVGKKAKGLKAGIGNVADDIALKGMYAGDAIKDGVGGVADDIALKGMYAGDAIKGGADDALLKAMYGIDWIKANPGKSALIGGGAAGAGVSAVALLNAIKNSKDEKVAAIWDAFIEKKASDNEAAIIRNEIFKFAGIFLDPETKDAARAAREVVYQDPEDYLNAIQMLAYNDYQKKKENPQNYSGPFEAGSEASFNLNNLLTQIKNNPEYKNIQKTMDKDIGNTSLGAILGFTAGAAGGGVLGGKLNQRAAQKTSRIINEAPQFSQTGMLLGMLGGSVGGAALGGRTATPAMAKLDPEKIQEYLTMKDGAPHATLKEL